MKERFLTGLAIFLVIASVLLTKIVAGTTIVFDVFVVGVYTFWILISSDILFLFCVLSFYSVDSIL